MAIVNDNIIRATLTSIQNVSSIHIIDWHTEDFTGINSVCASKISRIRVLYRQQKEDSAPPEEKFFFCKVPINDSYHDILKDAGFYTNEVIMYTKILPQIYKIETEEYFTPKHYYFHDDMSLVLEDLSKSGYSCAELVEKLDVEQCILALKCLAKFHALSVKLENTVGLPISVKEDLLFKNEKLTTFINNVCIPQQIPLFIDSVPKHITDQYPNFVTYLKNLTAETVIDSVNHSLSGKFNVLNHGDLKIDNLMFKYDKFGTVKEVKLIDFQTISWRSPAYDLTFFITACMKFEDYLKYFSLLIKIYVGTLNRILRKLQCPTLDEQNLLDDINNLHPFAVYIVSCLLPFLLSDQSEPVDLKDSCTTEKSDSKCTTKAYKRKLHQENSAKWFEHFAKSGTIRTNEENISSNECSAD